MKTVNAPSATTTQLPLQKEHERLRRISGGTLTPETSMREALSQCIERLRTESLREETLRELHAVFLEEFPDARCTRYLLGSLFLGMAFDEARWEKGTLPPAKELYAQVQRTVKRVPDSDEWRDRALSLYEEASFNIIDKPDPVGHLIGGFGTAYYYYAQYALRFPEAYLADEETNRREQPGAFPKIFRDSLRRAGHSRAKFTTDSFNVWAYEGAEKEKPMYGKVNPHVPQTSNQYDFVQRERQLLVEQKATAAVLEEGMGCLALHARMASGKSVFDDFTNRFLAHWEREWFPLLAGYMKGTSPLYEYNGAILRWEKQEMEALKGVNTVD